MSQLRIRAEVGKVKTSSYTTIGYLSNELEFYNGSVWLGTLIKAVSNGIQLPQVKGIKFLEIPNFKRQLLRLISLNIILSKRS